MSKKKEYLFYKCRDCEIDFFIAKKVTNRSKKFCPECGENLFTDKITEMRIERPFQYHRPWTTEEDELIKIGMSAGYTQRRIAESLDGRTKNAVQSRWKRLKQARLNVI